VVSRGGRAKQLTHGPLSLPGHRLRGVPASRGPGFAPASRGQTEVQVNLELGLTTRSPVAKPSRKNVATYLEKVRGISKASKHVTAGHLIVNLTPVIRGWANYHRHEPCKRTFSPVDHAIFRALWQFAKRRHPKRS